MEPACHIIGAGDICEKDFEQLKNTGKKDLIIAADGGYTALAMHNITPKLFVGDLDSCKLSCEDIPSSVAKRILTPKKDYTDVHISIEEGLSRGYRSFHLYGCTGGRISHTLANLQLMAWLAGKGCSARMYGRNEIFEVIVNTTLTLPERDSGYISIFSLSDSSTGVTLTGLKYPLENYTLTNTFPLGVSNEFIGCKAAVTVKNGTLGIIIDGR